MGLTNVDLYRIDGNVGSLSNVQTSALNGGPLAGVRNRIINGDMRIDQRNAGASVTIPNNASTYTLDRWVTYSNNDGVCSVQRVSETPTGFSNSLKFTTTTADASLSATQRVVVQQFVEGFNTSDLGWGTASAQPITLSFWIRSSLTGTFGGAFGNSAQSRSYPFTYTINSANTFEYKTVTVTGDTSGTWLSDNGVGVRIYFGLGVGSTYSGTAGAWAASDLNSATGAVSVIGTLSATWQITGVQLEAGTVATPFERRSYGAELSLCQRYFAKMTATAQYAGFGAAAMGNATNGNTFIKYPMTLRSSPTFAYNDLIFSYGGTITGVNGSYFGFDSCMITFATSGMTTNTCAILFANSSASFVSFASEL